MHNNILLYIAHMDCIMQLFVVSFGVDGPKRKNDLFLATLLSFLLLATPVIGIASNIIHDSTSRRLNNATLQSQAVMASTRAATNRMITSQKEVIKASLNLTTAAVQHNFFTVEKLISARGEALMRRDRVALRDCMEMINETLEELPKVHLEKMCTNALAMIKNMTDTDIEIDRQMVNRYNLGGEEKPRPSEGGWPGWLSHGDRKLMESPSVKPDVVVADDGSGKYRTVAEVVEAAPPNSSNRFVIWIKAGTYNENVVVPSTKTNIMFIGDGAKITTITGNRSNRSGSGILVSGTVAVLGDRFLARDLTFENTAGPEMAQAVALRVDADLSAFFRCNILGYQDTLYVRLKKQFFVKCQIEGTVDFIFGDSAAFFQDCDILARYPGEGKMNMVTAQSRNKSTDNTGIVIHKCRIGASSELEPYKRNISTYLGRPWGIYSRTVIMYSTISDIIHPAGWHDWNGDFARQNTLYYGEYNNTGIGADTSKRVAWKGFKVITSPSEARKFTARRFIDGKQWLLSTGFPFSLGL